MRVYESSFGVFRGNGDCVRVSAVSDVDHLLVHEDKADYHTGCKRDGAFGRLC